MYKVVVSKNFSKSLKKISKSGNFSRDEIQAVVDLLASGKKLNIKYKDHKLQGEYKDCRECHIRPDLLLIYQIIDNELVLVLIDIGSHSDLFK